MDSLMRHVRNCNNARLPGGRQPLSVADDRIGWLDPAVADRFAGLGAATHGDAVTFASAALLDAATRALARENVFRWRGEAFDLRATADGTVLGEVDRGALPILGALAWGVHVNGLVRRADGIHVWIARRASNKLLDPGKLDHLVAGGVSAGMTLDATLVKEAAEEAGLSPDLAARAEHVATLSYAMQRPEGLRRDVLACYDLDLPESVTPRPVDGEVEAFELWPVTEVLDRVRHSEEFKFNVNVVLIDLFLRLALIEGDEAAELRRALGQPGW